MTCVFSPPAAWEPTLHTPICLCRGTAFLLLGNPTGDLPFHSSLSKANRRWGKSKIQQQILAYADKSIPDSVVTLTRSSLKFSSPSSSPSSLRVPTSQLFTPPLLFHPLFLTEVSLSSIFVTGRLLFSQILFVCFLKLPFFCVRCSASTPLSQNKGKEKSLKLKDRDKYIILPLISKSFTGKSVLKIDC